MGRSQIFATFQFSHFDTAFGGMGGCPFIKGASGNISTEDLVFMLHRWKLKLALMLIKSLQSADRRGFFCKASGKMHHLLKRADIECIG